MYQAIVVGTDGSNRAARAIAEALGLAKLTGATLHVVHVVRTVSAPMMGVEGVDHAAVAKAHADLHDEGALICSNVVAEAGRQGVAIEAHNVEGDAADVLIDVAKAVDADLVVIGNKGMSGIKRFVLGSVPNKVSHHCPCNLLIVNTDDA
jgi:nucleotide-binding universal stress UspA family protein